MLRKVISGGQTGADQAGLLAAVECGIPTGGWLPHGCATEDGPRPDMLEEYGMIEYSGGYAPRTAANVRNSDGTIRIAHSLSSPGERCTLKAIRKYDKLHIDVDVTSPRPYEEVVRWIEENNIEILNVAGNRESTFPGMAKFAQEYLSKVFMELQ